MTDLFVQLLDQYDQLREELDQIGEESALEKAQKLLDDIKEAGKLVVDPDERRILSNLAYDLGEIIFDVSGFYPSVRLMSTAGEGAWRRLGEATEKAGKLEELEYFYHTSRVYLAKEQWEAAIGYLERIVGLDAEYQDAAVLLDEARRQLRLRTLYTEADIRLREGECAKAIKLFKEIVLIDPTYKDAQAKLNRALTRNLYEEALGHLRGERWSQAIEVLETIRDYRDAADKLKGAREQQYLATLYMDAVEAQETGQWRRAIDEFQEIVRMAGVYKDVARRLDQVQGQLQQELVVRFSRGERYLRQRRWEEAAAEFERVNVLDPDYRSVRARLQEVNVHLHPEELRRQGEASLRIGRWREAVEIFGELCRIAPLDADSVAKLEEAKKQLQLEGFYNEGMRYYAKERWGKAVTALGKVVSLAPDYRDAAAKLKIARENLSQSSPLVRFLTNPVLAGFANVAPVIAFIVAAVPIVIGLAIAVSRIVGSVVATPTPKPPTLCDGTFDDKFECWEHGGELEQSVKCEGGQCYAVLGSSDYRCEGGVPMGEAWIKQSFQISPTIATSPTLSLRYRVFSYDLDTQDWFQVQINDDLVGQYGDSLGSVPSCDREPWDSGWRTVEFDLSRYEGQKVEVLLSNVNSKYEWWNTWTYVDDVQIR